MQRDDLGHDWELVQQAHPRASRPFGFICCCGAGFMASFGSAREATRAARSHTRDSEARGRAA